jgi:two-component system sensor histidine kinase/response regulator
MKNVLALVGILFSLFINSQNERIDNLTVQLAYQEQDSVKVDLSLQLIEELYNIKDYKKALLYVNQTAKLAEELNYLRGLAVSSYYRALIYTKRNDYFNAIDNYQKSRNYYITLRDTLGVAKVSNSIGIIEIKRGNYSLGLKNSLAAIQIFEKRNLKDHLSTAYNNLAEAYFKTKQFDKALDFNLKALEVRQNINDTEGILQSSISIAELYSLRKEHRKAIEFYERVLQMLNTENDQNLRGDILPKLGNEYLAFKEYKKAGEVLVKGLRISRKQNNQEGILSALNAIGNLNLQKGNLKLAASQLGEAYAIAKKIDNTSALLENYRLQITLDSTRGRFQNAFFWQNNYYDLKQKLEKASNETLIPNEELLASDRDDLFELDSTQPISLAQPDTEADKASNNYLLYGLIAAIFLLVIFLIVSLTKTNAYRKESVTSRRKIAEVSNQNSQLSDQVQHLEEVNEVKDKLFSIVSHDLKDSISSIKAFLDLLKEDSISKEEFNDLIPELSENADNASLLLYNLLNWSKSQMQSLDPKPELFDIQDVFHTKIALVEQKVEDKRIVLIDESQRDFVYADKSMIEIVIQNLITNAVKFSRTSDVITISNQEKNGKALICVEDTGVGIAPENLEKLFNANNTFTTIGTKNEKGTGLGLTIAKDLVELNHGKIWVESTPNVGSKFFIELPKSAPKA